MSSTVGGHVSLRWEPVAPEGAVFMLSLAPLADLGAGLQGGGRNCDSARLRDGLGASRSVDAGFGTMFPVQGSVYPKLCTQERKEDSEPGERLCVLLLEEPRRPLVGSGFTAWELANTDVPTSPLPSTANGGLHILLCVWAHMYQGASDS